MSDVPANAPEARSARFVPLVGIVLAVLGALVVLLWQAQRSPSIVYLDGDGPGEWITAPYPLQTRAIRATPASQLRFERRFDVESTEGAWTLQVRALGALEVLVNRQPIAGPADEAWRDAWRDVRTFDLAEHLRAGRNRLTLTVTNERGPAAVQATLVGPNAALATDADSDWQVSIDPDGPQGIAAIVADDTRPHPDGEVLDAPWTALRDKLPQLGVIYGLVLVVFVALRRGLATRIEWMPRIATGVVVVAWFVWLVASFWALPLELGFDYTGHLGYLEQIDAGDWLPLAGEGWSSYHPPLFYWTAHVVQVASDPLVGAAGLKLATFAAALANVFVASRLATRFFPEQPGAVAFATLFAGFLPVNVYMAAYVSNEPLSGMLVGATILATVGVVLAPDAGARRWGLVGALLGLALLTKFTALVLVPFLLVFLLLARRSVPDGTWRRAGAWVAGVLGVAAALSGWYYVRNVSHFGRPLVFNFETGDWWQMPGFRTVGYYDHFGAVFARPFFVSFEGFWDGLYSTLFGDGLVAGKAGVALRHEGWDYGWMAAGYVLALPVCLLVFVGLGRLVRDAARAEEPARRLASALIVVLHVAFLTSAISYSLKAPMFSTVKAGFVLGLLGPLSVSAALGARAVRGWLERTPLAPALYGLDALWGTLLVVVFLTYLG